MMTATLTTQLSRSIRHITPVWADAPTGVLGELYQQMQADFMPGPVLTLHSPAPQVMAGVWSMLRETLLAGKVDRTAKEIVAAAISKRNECPFCIDAHTSMLHATGEHALVRAILRGDGAEIRHPQHRALVQWLADNHPPQAANPAPPPFAPQEIPEMLGTALAFHYINRMANLFLGDAFLPLPSTLKGPVRRLLGTTMGKRLVRPLAQGASLRFVPSAPLPEDLAWARPNTAVSGALAGFARIMEEAGQAALPASVRALVQARVDAWQGETLGISRRWVEADVAPLATAERPVARLALLTALASYQVDEQLIAAVRAQLPDDQRLIQATAWASFTAARRAIGWLAAPLYKEQEIR
jgi:AhpD family alkylhydroperoxidase